MSFASINSTNPRTNLWNFGENYSAFGGCWKTQFFWVGHFDFFASFLLKLVTIYGVPRIFRNFDDYPDFQQKARAGGYKIMSNTVFFFNFIYNTLAYRNHCEWWKATRTHFYGLYYQPYHEKEISWFPRGPCFCHSNLSFQKLQSTVGVRMRRVNTILLQTWRMTVVASLLSFIFHKFCLTKKVQHMVNNTCGNIAKIWK